MKEYIEKNLKTEIIGKNIIFFDEIDSTQEKAKQLAEGKVENGTIILANKQTNGIGTHGRKWYTKEDDSIAFTIILYPKGGIESLKDLTIDIAVCMVDTIEELYGIKLDIKKPNDLMCHQKKVGGILTQITTVRRENKIFINWNGNECEYCSISSRVGRNRYFFKKRVWTRVFKRKNHLQVLWTIREENIYELLKVKEER